jgi:hypothetical protein
MSKAKVESHPTTVDVTSGAISLMSQMKLLRHVLDCDECRATFAAALSSFSDSYCISLWMDEGLSERTANALVMAGILTLEDLRKTKLRRGIGRKGAEEIRELLANHKEGE